MKRNTLITIAALLTGWLTPSFAQTQQKEVHILSGNDMHAKLENMPMLADIADSLRTLYPSLLVFSAGDNRTGEPLNDMYEPTGYPMVALMNQIGFDATTLGNHEFDSSPRGMAKLIGLSTFSYICANVHPDDSLGVHLIPCKTYDVEGIRVGVVGAVQLGTHGLPDTHPDNTKGLTFDPVNETVASYEWMRKKCDVVMLLSHNGYEEDVQTAKLMPWLDVIIGGHTHTQLKGGEMHNGVLITQNVNKLKKVTHTTIVLQRNSDSDSWRIASKSAENIDVQEHKGKNKVVADMVRFFSDNPDFKQVLATLDKPLTTYEELGCLMCDAFISEAGADVGIENYGGVRYGEKEAGPFTVADVLRLDPFGNDAVIMEITGEELRQMLMSCYTNDGKNFPYVSGLMCELERDSKDTTEIKKLTLKNAEGKKLNMKKKYKVVTNSYVASIADSPRKDQGQNINRKTADLIIDFLKKKQTVDYKGAARIKIVK